MVSENVYGAYRPPNLGEALVNGFSKGQEIAAESQRMSDLARQRKKQEGYEATLAKNVGPDGKMNKAAISQLAGQGYGKEAFELGGVIEEQEAKSLKARQDAHARQLSAVGGALERIAALKTPEERAQAYGFERSRLIQSGLADPTQIPEAYDDNKLGGWLGEYQQTKEYLEKKGIVLGQQKTMEDMANDKKRIALDASKIEQADRHKVADITGNARLAEKRGQQQIAAIDAQGKNAIALEEARGGQSRLTKGTASADQLAKSSAEDPYKMTTEAKMKKLAGTDKGRLDNVRLAYGEVGAMAEALKGGDNTFTLWGDNDFTAAKTRFAEALGRMQSGGAITTQEEEKFARMAPTYRDSPDMKQKKLAALQKEMGARFKTLGFDPEEFGLSTQLANITGGGVGDGTKNANAAPPVKSTSSMTDEELMAEAYGE